MTRNAEAPALSRGLVNGTGAACYLNAVLQALTPLPPFSGWLSFLCVRAMLVHEDAEPVVALRLRGVLAQLLAPQSAWPKTPPLLPRSLLAALPPSPLFGTSISASGGRAAQQDAHEAALVLFGLLEAEAATVHDKVDALAAGRNLAAAACGMRKLMIAALQPSLPPLPLRGTLCTRLRCVSCGAGGGARGAWQHEAFSALSLPVPAVSPLSTTRSGARSGGASVRGLLARHFAGERIADWACEARACKGGAARDVALGLPPRVLLLHLKRAAYAPSSSSGGGGFGGRAGGAVKTAAFVAIDMRLDLAAFAAGGSAVSAESRAAEAAYTYELRAVIEHRGGATGGHYVCYRRAAALLHPLGGRGAGGGGGGGASWLRCSDEDVTAVAASEALGAEAFLLAYVRRDALAEPALALASSDLPPMRLRDARTLSLPSPASIARDMLAAVAASEGDGGGKFGGGGGGSLTVRALLAPAAPLAAALAATAVADDCRASVAAERAVLPLSPAPLRRTWPAALARSRLARATAATPMTHFPAP